MEQDKIDTESQEQVKVPYAKKYELMTFHDLDGISFASKTPAAPKTCMPSPVNHQQGQKKLLSVFGPVPYYSSQRWQNETLKSFQLPQKQNQQELKRTLDEKDALNLKFINSMPVSPQLSALNSRHNIQLDNLSRQKMHEVKHSRRKRIP